MGVMVPKADASVLIITAEFRASAAIDEPIDTFVDGVTYALSDSTTPLLDPFITPLKVLPEMLAAGED
ncbi:hypothetical protein Tco_1171029 [Tanacetum coccineum]